VDFLLALAAVPPAPPAPGKASSSNEVPAGIAASDFAAHISQAGTSTGGLGQLMPLPGEHGPPSEPPVSSSRDASARERQVGRMSQHPDVLDCRPDHMLRPATEHAQTIAEAIVDGVPSTAASKNRATAIGPEVPAAHERVEAKVTDRPDASQPETPVAEPEHGPERPILIPSPEQLLPPSDAPVAATEHDPAKTPELQAGPVSTGAGAVALAPAVTSGVGFTIARHAPPEALEPRLARGASDTAGAPVPPAGASATASSGATGPSEAPPAGTGRDAIARAVEPRRALAPKDGADGDHQGLFQEKPATQDASVGSQVRASDPSARQQPSSDAQPGRPAQISGMPGNAVAAPHPATGVNGEIAQLIARTQDGALSVEPGPHPATRQVALQITRALDQDRTEIRIRLDPPELGEVDIQLEFRDLRLSASVSAERPDTLELLQRDSRSLTRALREAGLELADSDLSFAHNGRNDRPDAGSYAQRAINLPHPLAAVAPLQDLSLALAGSDGFVSLSDGRMDLRV
jgi:flagellar hook-length control protein FliK